MRTVIRMTAEEFCREWEDSFEPPDELEAKVNLTFRQLPGLHDHNDWVWLWKEHHQELERKP